MEALRIWRQSAQRRLKRRQVLRGSVAGVASLALAGCTSAPPAASTAAPAAARTPAATGAAAAPATAVPRPKLGGTILTMGTSPERNLEPHQSTGAAAGAIGALNCYSGLLTYKWGPDVPIPSYISAPDLAESWQQADDLTYIFKLRPGVKFHNLAPVHGREVVAEDIIYSYNRIREQRSYASFLAGIAKMEAPDKSTFKLTLDKPSADLLNNLAVYNLVIVARERAEQTADLGDPPVIGTGPFLLDSFTVNERVVMKRNPDYYLKGQPYVDGLEAIRSVGDPSRLVNAFRAGAINFLNPGLTIQQAEDIKKAMPGAVVRYGASDRVQTELILNANLEMFKDVRVRQAIHKAIDRKAIIDSVFLGRGRYTTGLSFPDASYSLPDAELARLFGRDVEGARRLLQQAGVSNLSFELTTPTYLSGAFVSAAELIQANLREVGITVTIKTVDTPTLLTAQQSGNFHATTGAYALGAPSSFLYSRYYTGGATNYAKFSNPELDKLIDQQAVMAKDPEGRKKVLQDIQRKFLEDAVSMPLVMYDFPLVHVPEMRDVYPPTYASNHNTFWVSIWFDK